MHPRTIVITGASSGFGRGLAQRLAERGDNLVLVARRKALVEDMAAEHRNAIAVHADVGNPDEVEKVAAAALARFPRIDAWVNNAGVAALGRFEDVPLRDHQQVLRTNLGGALNGSHVAMRHFRRMGSGTLVNVASMLGRTPAPYYASYCASKYGIVGLCASLRQELALDRAERIRVCAVLPMAADTPFYEHAANYTGRSLQPFPITDPWQVVEALVDAVDNPRDEIVVGLPAKAAMASQQFMPWLTEGATAAVSQQLQMEDAPPADPTGGNLHSPLQAGTGVEGQARARMAAERRVRRS
ncbi:SDR family NAD(P)-dependent oxidoreductase [Lysobacter sp. GX 14042]|uniref:SDR family NAD(P)-dependent oxidoreductase n=1 Tax=Lysobacter sp. GX 14042 TaxID=2907155 RepID=UPI001F293B43|nr:SDR family NAD(P)-dependent oxidoreductase [Lysobacter sp. GX 14042]MCE7031128.1 SDR family NAD(P)-dependent oxidoreductase [Lysobacter sp. GX 14042]